MITQTKKTLIAFSALFLASIACGQFSVNIETPSPTVEVVSATEDSTPTPEPPPQTLSPEPPSETPTRTAGEGPDGSQYWVEMQDPQFENVRFAVPCFWEVNFPERYPPTFSALAYPIRNYTDEYALSFPRGEGIWESGAIKIDMNFIHGPGFGVAPGTSMPDLVNNMYSNDPQTDLLSAEAAQINGQPALLVTTEGTFGRGQFYLFTVSEEYYLAFGTSIEAFENPDVQAILHSIALSPEVSVQIPTAKPGPPPEGLTADCLGTQESSNGGGETLAGLSCGAISPGTPEWVACNIRDGLLSRNTAALTSFMGDPFSIGYWRSEGVMGTPFEMIEQIQNLYNFGSADYTPQLTFTTDRSQMPHLEGMPIEGMFGPDVAVSLIVYSEGWNPDGQGAALIYIAQNTSGEYYWHGMVYAFDHFE